MCMSYLYSKLPETGVSPHIDTGGTGANIMPDCAVSMVAMSAAQAVPRK
jgi:hypothetical protein